jgi:hypothetical protein
MKTHVSRILVTLSVGVALGACQLMAQDSVLHANVPFAFTAGTKSLPAGQYKVSADTVTGVVRVSSADYRENLLIIAIRSAAPNAAGVCKLVFHRYGDRYFLSQIWRPGDIVRELPKSKAEREQMATSTSPSRVTVVASAN